MSIQVQISESATSTSVRLPRASKPPKLQHILKNNKMRSHDLVKAIPRDDGLLRAPDFDSDYDDYDESDYAKVVRFFF